MEKGGVEPTGGVTQLMREELEGREDLAVLRLDYSNAYMSILHKLVKTLLKRHHVTTAFTLTAESMYQPGSLRQIILSLMILSKV